MLLAGLLEVTLGTPKVRCFLSGLDYFALARSFFLLLLEAPWAASDSVAAMQWKREWMAKSVVQPLRSEGMH